MVLTQFLWSETETFRVTVFYFNAIFAEWQKAFFLYYMYIIYANVCIYVHIHIYVPNRNIQPKFYNL